MKKISLLLFILAVARLGAQDCFWAKRAGGVGYEEGQSITVDPNGNAYVVGSFSDNTIQFSPFTLTNTSPGNSDFFVVKYSKAGTVKWARNYGSAVANGITSDSNGNIYITGTYGNSYLKFGTDTVFNSNPGSSSIFLVKLDSSGNVLWANTPIITGTPGNMGVSSNAITYDENGHIYTTGQFLCNYIIFGGDTVYYSSSSGYSFFITKYDVNGNCIWAKGSRGTGYDYGLSVDADPGNLYVSGRYSSPLMIFDGDTLTGTNSDQAFALKCDSAGNLLWMKGSQAAVSYGLGITTDGNGNAYMTGTFQGSFIIFGADTLYDNWMYDFFLTKYDPNGNTVWVRGTTGGYADDRGHGITADTAGNIYVTGQMGAADTVWFGNVMLVNPSYFQNTAPLFVVKYDPAGNALSGLCSVSTPTLTGGGKGAAIAVDNSGKVYTTGYFSGTIKLGNVTLSTAGVYDFFVFHTYPFTISVTTTSVSCYGNADGSAGVSINGGASPYTYTWMPMGQTTPAVSGLSAGTDSVRVTDSNGCSRQAIFTITQPAPDLLSICMVTVDSASQYNIVTWDKTSFNDIDTFIIYREISTNNYQPIAAVRYDSLSMFVDTVRTMYFPNTGDPNAGTYRYKLKAHLTCGGYASLSPYHNTIYFLNNNGTFYWTQPYTVENAANPVSSYVLLRDDFSTGNWQPVSSVAGTQQTISDPLYSIYQNTASWRVQTQWSISCNPTLKTNAGVQSAFNSSYSNIYTNAGIGMQDHNLATFTKIYPSPNTGIFTVECAINNARLEIYNVLGEQVAAQQLHQGVNTVNAALPDGSYIARLVTEKGVVSKKVIVQR